MAIKQLYIITAVNRTDEVRKNMLTLNKRLRGLKGFNPFGTHDVQIISEDLGRIYPLNQTDSDADIFYNGLISWEGYDEIIYLNGMVKFSEYALKEIIREPAQRYFKGYGRIFEIDTREMYAIKIIDKSFFINALNRVHKYQERPDDIWWMVYSALEGVEIHSNFIGPRFRQIIDHTQLIQTEKRNAL